MEVINVWLRELKYNGTLKTWMRHFHVLFWTICQVKSKSGKWVYAQRQYSHYGENNGDVNETQGNCSRFLTVLLFSVFQPRGAFA